ncbi:unnamed protein product [Ambrosiozyma monospora]|uniref:Unnamed protein product n=1 Tax=Ambrosiozyma monospora TaxID=43982 RepID=A0ACB5ST41_AMBMO|nr:unnamed protein product [Ambrosiozyma monospora]
MELEFRDGNIIINYRQSKHVTTLTHHGYDTAKTTFNRMIWPTFSHSIWFFESIIQPKLLVVSPIDISGDVCFELSITLPYLFNMKIALSPVFFWIALTTKVEICSIVLFQSLF